MKTDVVNIDPEILGGTPVFRGTRVPIESLFDNLEAGMSLDEFINDFPSVTKKQAIAVLDMAGKIVSSAKAREWYETAVGCKPSSKNQTIPQ